MCGLTFVSVQLTRINRLTNCDIVKNVVERHTGLGANIKRLSNWHRAHVQYDMKLQC